MRNRFTGLWRHRNFRTLWMGESLSMLGSRVTEVALPLAAVVVLEASAAQLGLLRALGSIPTVILGLIAGAWVDRARKRPILVAANLGKACILAVPPLAAVAGVLRIEVLYAVALVSGVLGVFLNLAFYAFLPILIGREHLTEGNTKLETSSSVSYVAGPGLAGGLMQVLSAPVALAVDAASFLVAALAMAQLRVVEPRPGTSTAGRDIRREIGEGIRVFLGNPIVRVISLSVATFAVFNNVIFTVIFIYMARDLNLSPAAIGLFFTLGSVGALLGSFAAQPAAARFGVGPTIVAAQASIGAWGLLFALAVAIPMWAVPLLVAAEFGQSFFNTIFNVNRTSLTQAIIPDNLQGRVRAATNMVGLGAFTLGAVLAGILGGTIGAGATVAVGAVGGVLPFLWLLFSPLRSVRAMPS